MRIITVVALFVAALDIGAKLAVMNKMAEGEIIPIVNGLLNLHYVRNSGAAYGLLTGQQRLLVILAAAAITFLIFFYARRLSTSVDRIALGMLLGGAIGNLQNRLLWGAVTDYIQINPLTFVFQIFNLADVSIALGTSLLLWSVSRLWKTQSRPAS